MDVHGRVGGDVQTDLPCCKGLAIKFFVNWESCEAEVMTLANNGSQGSGLPLNEFQMDYNTYTYILERYFNYSHLAWLRSIL